MKTKNLLLSILTLIGFITAIGLFIDIMAPDGALYASIAKTMYLNNDFVNLFSLGKDWLDKPHMPFWLTAISFKVFGLNNFAYKFPAVLVFAFGIWLTYKFTKENYNKETALIATIILATSLHSVISNFDVRAEPFLTAFIIASVYYFDRYIKNKKLKHLLLGCLFAGFSLMTKGVFTLIPIIAALAGELIVKRNWKQLFSPIWLIAFVIILIVTLPELYTLYLQFDLHPEKLVFEKNNVSGLKFFFWDSQFGRFFNTGPIVNHNGSIFFFLHTLLWAFLPWSILFYLATFFKVKRNLKKTNRNEEFYSVFAALTAIIVFSVSKFQLAHYTNIIFPFMAIITADFIYKLKESYQTKQKLYTIIQTIVSVLTILLIPVLFYLMIDEISYLFIVITIVIIFLLFMTVKNKERNKVDTLFIISSLSFMFVYTFLITNFYPTLLKYQGGVYAARQNNQSNSDIHIFVEDAADFGFEFYTAKNVNRIRLENVASFKDKTFYVSDNFLQHLNSNKVSYYIDQDFDNFRITRLNLKFANKNTRKSILNKTHIITLK
ncbi:4-amino-4-deoxy-L-arabinose transferase [Tenacibaculum sp. MAR_2009_124]|uniref:ArnT family glycosyltransferase n=1 Tax=Tenacibaculum sp. MAR_2009_124 TaxID=1250059 RepID=UPI000895E681|nr:glycosyltransferase family 39 protein [Tenacibaculum sp. MAR_2009_124]SEB35934.1 4-amino-4-deoxy-L-arabinose transferase [Tenacibaculum sp. MAR_2009_124]